VRQLTPKLASICKKAAGGGVPQIAAKLGLGRAKLAKASTPATHRGEVRAAGVEVGVSTDDYRLSQLRAVIFHLCEKPQGNFGQPRPPSHLEEGIKRVWRSGRYADLCRLRRSWQPRLSPMPESRDQVASSTLMIVRPSTMRLPPALSSNACKLGSRLGLVPVSAATPAVRQSKLKTAMVSASALLTTPVSRENTGLAVRSHERRASSAGVCSLSAGFRRRTRLGALCCSAGRIERASVPFPMRLPEDCSCPLGLHQYHSARQFRWADLDLRVVAARFRRTAHRRLRTALRRHQRRPGRSHRLSFHPTRCCSTATYCPRPGPRRSRSRFQEPSPSQRPGQRQHASPQRQTRRRGRWSGRRLSRADLRQRRNGSRVVLDQPSLTSTVPHSARAASPTRNQATVTLSVTSADLAEHLADVT
jgi:hypothetical protein